MTNLSILYNTNPMPLMICVPPHLGNLNNKGRMHKKNYKKIPLFLQEGRKRERKMLVGLLLKW
jgi:hypothetical protein